MWVMVSFTANGYWPGEASVPCATADAGVAPRTAAVSTAATATAARAGVKMVGTVDLQVSEDDPVAGNSGATTLPSEDSPPRSGRCRLWARIDWGRPNT